MILTDLSQFAVQRRRKNSRWIREHRDVLINITHKRVLMRCDNPDCAVEGGREWHGNLHQYYDEDFHECLSCKRTGERSARAMLGRTPWNKGLTAEDDKRVAAYVETGAESKRGKNYGRVGPAHPSYGRSINAGPDNPMYVDGKCYERDGIRKEHQHRRWSKDVLRRDDYTCRCCGARGGKLHAHHLYDFDTYPEKRCDLGNGVCLCHDCHYAFHSWVGTLRDTCTAEDFGRYLEEVVYVDA